MKATLETLHDFSMRMFYYQLNADDGNLAVSPLGAFFVVQVLNEGLDEEAREHASVDRCELEALKSELDRLPSLAMTARLFVERRADLLDSFVAQSERLLPSLVAEAPLHTHPDRAVEIVNAMLAEQTYGYYTQAIKAIPEELTMVMATTLRYDGEWVTPFRVAETAPGDFNLPSDEGEAAGASMKVPMMRVLLPSANIQRVRKGLYLKLPYRDGVELVLMLPDEGQQTNHIWDVPRFDWEQEVAPEGVTIVELPRFEIKLPDQDWSQGWANLELTFERDDLDSILRDDVEAPDLINIGLFHRAAIRVAENEVEEVAPPRSPAPSPTISGHIKFDRPFCFYLRHSGTGAVVMMGRLERPLEWPTREGVLLKADGLRSDQGRS